MRLGHTFSYAVRSLRRAPLFSASVVVTLTVAIGSAAAIFSLLNGVLLRPLPFGHADRLVGVWFDMASLSLNHAQQTPGTYETFRRYARTIDAIGLYPEGSANVSDPDGRGDPERINTTWATASTIPLLEISPLVGRTFSKAEDVPNGPRVALISEGYWRSHYAADKNVVGKTLMIYGRATTIVGVMPARFRFPGAATEIWLPLQLDLNNPYSGGFSYNAVARLKAGVSIEAAQRDFATVLPRTVEVTPNLTPTVPMKMVLDQAKPVVQIVPMRDDVVGNVSSALWMVAAAALVLLLAACANVANLLLVRADARHRELAVRSALGAGRARVLAHFFTESAVLTGLSCALGLVAAWAGIHALVTAGPSQIPRLAEVHIDGAVVAFTIAVGVLIALASSAIPALRFMRADPLSGLRDGGRGGTAGGHRQRARGALVAAQVAFALVVLSSSALLVRSFQRLRAVHPGFEANGVATLWFMLQSQRYPSDTSVVQFAARLIARAAQAPGVTRVGVGSWLPLEENGQNHDPVYVEGEASPAKIPQLASYLSIDSGYFGAMGIPIIAGHTFDRIERQRAG
ncbi:MAG: ABC transporter permease, partial [Gemmatimonadales bacterium]